MVKVLKKATKRHQRQQNAKQKLRLATTAAIVQGMYQQTASHLEMETFQREKLENIKWWTDHCLAHVELGKHAVIEATRLTKIINEIILSVIGQENHNKVARCFG